MSMKVIKEKTVYKKGFGFYYCKALDLKSKDIVYAISFYLFKKDIFMISYCQDGWEDNKGNKQVFKRNDKTLYLKKISINI